MDAPSAGSVIEALEHMPIRGVANAVSCAGPNLTAHDVQRYVRARCDPILYLSQLTEHSRPLLAVMASTGVVLTGSRAAEYFNPGLCKADSDWDFFGGGNLDALVRFTKCMQKFGTVWGPVLDSCDGGYSKVDVLTGTLNGHKVQLICSFRHTFETMEYILSFHSSIVQCLLSGFCAVSLYDSLSCKKLSLPWSPTHPATEPVEAWAKYKERGVRYVSYAYTMSECTGDGEYHSYPIGHNRSMDQAFNTVRLLTVTAGGVVTREVAQRNLDSLLKTTKWHDNEMKCTPLESQAFPVCSIDLGTYSISGQALETPRERAWYRELLSLSRAMRGDRAAQYIPWFAGSGCFLDATQQPPERSST